MSTALDIVKGALRAINSYQPGDTIASYDENDVLEVLNNLIESWTTDHNINFGTNEWVLQWVAGQRQYTVGNPMNTDIGEASFTGTVTGGSNLITGVTNIPSDLVAGTTFQGSNAGSTLIDSAGVFPAGTYVTSFNSISQTVNTNHAATATPSSNPVSFDYSIPGNFGIQRPLRITSGYTRFSNLDFTLNVCATEQQYNAILYKIQPGPWPIVAWYNDTYPYGILNVYQQPGNSADFHMFTDTLLANLTASSTIIMPQGYKRALVFNLAREISPMFGKPITPDIKKIADESLALVKALNAKPAPRASYDRFLTRGNRYDAGFVFSGGYNN